MNKKILNFFRNEDTRIWLYRIWFAFIFIGINYYIYTSGNEILKTNLKLICVLLILCLVYIYTLNSFCNKKNVLNILNFGLNIFIIMTIVASIYMLSEHYVCLRCDNIKLLDIGFICPNKCVYINRLMYCVLVIFFSIIPMSFFSLLYSFLKEGNNFSKKNVCLIKIALPLITFLIFNLYIFLPYFL